MDINMVGLDDSEYIFDKTIDCPVCKKKFQTKQMKTGKSRFLGTEIDLRPTYDGIDPVKYDVIQCPNCGYSALTSNFDSLTSKQITKVKEGIASKFKPVPIPEGAYSYVLAIRRFKLALITAMVKGSKVSECGYICLKLSWLYRGAKNELKELPSDNAATIAEYEKREQQFQEEAYAAFKQAVSSEYPPICNMDESTMNYLLAALGKKCNDLNLAKQNAYLVISSRSANRKLKDKARELIDEMKDVE